MFNRNFVPRYALAVAVVCGVVSQTNALPTVGTEKKKQLLKTAAGCDPATATIELDINNVRARVMTGGDMWWNQGVGNAAYEVPKGSKKNSLFAGSVWVGGFTKDRQLKVCAQTYRSEGNDYWPGPLKKDPATNAMTVTKEDCSDWDRFWKVDRATINRFREFVRSGNIAATKNSQFQSIWEWPAIGNGVGSATMNNNDYRRAIGTSGLPLNMDGGHPGYAPFVNNPEDPGNNPDIYEPERGDFPGDPTIGDLLGDQYIWWVFNDLGNVKGQTKTEAIGMEVQTGAFAFASKDFMNDATFYNYRLINWSTSDLDSTFMATWTDADLGYAFDDYIGCDTVRGLGILYNGDGFDGAGEANSYGSELPMVGVDFFRGPHYRVLDKDGKVLLDSVLKMTAFTYFNNGNDQRIGDPTNGVQVYNYITGTSRNGQNFNNDFQGAGVPSNALGNGPDTRFVFFGDPDKNEWSECNCGNSPWDRRFIHSAGPFILRPGDVNDITIGAVWVSNVGGCPNTNFKKIRLADDQAQALFDNNFKTIEGPEAPLLVKREMDNKIIFYFTNPSYSTNYQEKFGYEVDSSKYRVKSLKAVNAKSADSLYKFEGYRVFQLKNNQISASQIFNERGEVDNTVAVEVFQCDLKNGISQVVNWQKDINIQNCPDTCWYPVVKVNGKDSGIRHSFEVTEDKFATGSNAKLINYRTYYYIAIAYANNNFANFDPGKNELTQDVVYLESAHGPGGSALQVIEAMPNPFSHNVGVQFNSDYGDGVVIKKMEGVGNGGNFLELTDASIQEALQPSNGHQSKQPTYEAGSGPIDVTVVDPLKVVPGTWNLYIIPDSTQPAPYTQTGNSSDPYVRLIGSKAKWKLVNNNNVVVTSEMNLDVVNDQILTDYGISVSIEQANRPGDDQLNGNGTIGGSAKNSSTIVFENPAVTWLAGVNDAEQTSDFNWIRSGGYTYVKKPGDPDPPCLYNDYGSDTMQFWEGMLQDFAFTTSTWAPYNLAAVEDRTACVFGVAFKGSTSDQGMTGMQGVDVVFTPDTSKWSRCIVLETDNQGLGEGGAAKFMPRSHQSWNKEYNANGGAVYSTIPKDTGFSWFPGYAINVETGQRLNIVFGEDSYLSNHGGRDMLWNPSSAVLDDLGNPIWGGRHFTYISQTPYDSCAALAKLFAAGSTVNVFRSFMWMGIPTVNSGFNLLPLKDGLIPTKTTLKFRVSRPYARYTPAGITAQNGGFPWYQFSTDNIARKMLSDAGNPYQDDKQKLLDRMFAVPNPYYGTSPSYESGRLDTRVRFVGLPQRATIMIYSLDGTLIRKIDKDNNVSFVDWDIRNAKGLPIASGMYLIHVNAEGIGEKIIRWFGAMRPIDITQY